MQELKQNESGSLQNQLGLPNINTYQVNPDDRVLSVLVKEIESLKSQVTDLQTKKIIDETQLPLEILEENNMIPRTSKKIKRGLGHRPLLKSEIEEAQKHSVNAAGSARYLGVCARTYKKYAVLYGIYNPDPRVRGKRNIVDPNRGTYPLNEILEGKHPNVSIWTVKDKLIRSGLKKPECEVCGYNQRRVGDNKVPLLLNHMDNDVHNHKLENLKLMCLNCTFLAGRGYIRRSKFKLDPDWIQNENKLERGKPSRY